MYNLFPMDIAALQRTLREFAAELLRLAEHASIPLHGGSGDLDAAVKQARMSIVHRTYCAIRSQSARCRLYTTSVPFRNRLATPTRTTMATPAVGRRSTLKIEVVVPTSRSGRSMSCTSW